MRSKVLQLARYTTEAQLILKRVRFPALENRDVLFGTAVDDNDSLAITGESSLFYKLKLSHGFFTRHVGQPFHVEFTFAVGDVEFELNRTFNLPEPVPGHCKLFFEYRSRTVFLSPFVSYLTVKIFDQIILTTLILVTFFA